MKGYAVVWSYNHYTIVLLILPNVYSYELLFITY